LDLQISLLNTTGDDWSQELLKVSIFVTSWGEVLSTFEPDIDPEAAFQMQNVWQ